jgi:hypothetical protein
MRVSFGRGLVVPWRAVCTYPRLGWWWTASGRNPRTTTLEDPTVASGEPTDPEEIVDDPSKQEDEEHDERSDKVPDAGDLIIPDRPSPSPSSDTDAPAP